MPHEHHQGPRNGRRNARQESLEGRDAEQRRPHDDPREPMRSAGGRSESFSRQRDAEQLRAGYSPRDWQRHDQPRNTRSEPDWDPERGMARPWEREFEPGGERWEEERYYGSPRYDRNEFGPERRGHSPYGYEGGYGRGYGRESERQGARHLPDWGPAMDEPERSGQHHLGQQLSDASRRLIGKVKRIVRNPKNYRRSDERIREDICDRLSVSDEVDPVDIEVMVSNGEVTLTGTVPTRAMKFFAEETADEVPGVHDVHNQLRIARGN